MVGVVASDAESSAVADVGLPGAVVFVVVPASEPEDDLLPVVVSPLLLATVVLVVVVLAAPSEPLVRLFRFLTSLRSVADSASMNMSDSTKAC